MHNSIRAFVGLSRTYAIVLGFLSFATLASAQDVLWAARYNGSASDVDRLNSTAVAANDDVYVTGTATTSSNGTDIVTIKYNSAGVRQWIRRFDGAVHGNDVGQKVAVDSMGNVFVGGTTMSDGWDLDFVVLKYDGNGTKRWTRTYDGEAGGYDQLWGLAIDGSGDVYVTGSSAGIDTMRDIETLKYSNKGLLMWERRYRGKNGLSDEDAVGIALDPDGNPSVVGNSRDDLSGDDFVIVRYNSSGAFQWANRLSGSDSNAIYGDHPQGIVVDASSNTIVFGEFDNSYLVTSLDWVIAKYDPSGNLLWKKVFNDAYNGINRCRAMTVLANGDLVAAGSVKNSSGNYDIGIRKYDADGRTLWYRTFGCGPGWQDMPTTAVQDGSSNTIIVGETSDASGNKNCLTLKYDAAGQRLWAHRFGTADYLEFATAVTVDSTGSPIVGGVGYRAGSGADYLTVKYMP